MCYVFQTPWHNDLNLQPSTRIYVFTVSAEVIFELFFLSSNCNWNCLPSLPITNVSSGTNDSQSSEDSSHGSSADVGAIVGGVLGGISILALFAASLLFFRRRRHHRRLVENTVLKYSPEMRPETFSIPLPQDIDLPRRSRKPGVWTIASVPHSPLSAQSLSISDDRSDQYHPDLRFVLDEVTSSSVSLYTTITDALSLDDRPMPFHKEV